MSNKTRTPRASRWQQAPALVISLVALFAALSGAALALPGTQTVNSGDIKDNAVKSIDLKDGAAVTGDDVTDESLTGTDVADGTIAGTDVTDESIASNDVQNETLLSTDISPTRRSRRGRRGRHPPGQRPGAELRPVRGDRRRDPQPLQHGRGCGRDGPERELQLQLRDRDLRQRRGVDQRFRPLDRRRERRGADALRGHPRPQRRETVTVKGGNDFGVDRTLVAVASCL